MSPARASHVDNLKYQPNPTLVKWLNRPGQPIHRDEDFPMERTGTTLPVTARLSVTAQWMARQHMIVAARKANDNKPEALIQMNRPV